jgi:hypothetical protein
MDTIFLIVTTIAMLIIFVVDTAQKRRAYLAKGKEQNG